MASLRLFSPSGVLVRAAPLLRARRRLVALGFDVEVDEAARLKAQRFAGDDASRIDAIHRVAARTPDIAMATRGGYGLTRLLDSIDWKRIARSVAAGTRWIGHSDFTAFQLASLAHGCGVTWAGPMACDDFGREPGEHGEIRSPAIDEVTEGCFLEAMSGELEAIGFRTEAGFDGLGVRGVLWGGNLCMVCSLLGTPHWPRVKGGVLFLEEINEHPYRIERSLLQLHQAGVLDAQKAIVLGDFSGWRKSPNDRGFDLKTVVRHIRSVTRTPVLTGLPFGHVPTKVSMPVGSAATLLVQGRDVLIGW
ncbi:MAG: LD-carboxypeptidase [Caldimonas sp.]